MPVEQQQALHQRPAANTRGPYGKKAYKWRHLMENVFVSIKEGWGSATCDNKTDSSDAANWNLVAALPASR